MTRFVRFDVPRRDKPIVINPAMVTEIWPDISETSCHIGLVSHQTPDYWAEVIGTLDEVLAKLEGK